MDNVIIADAMMKELFYVAASCGRSEIAVVISDRELLRDPIGVSTARQSAIELVRKPQYERGVEKPFEISRLPDSRKGQRVATVLRIERQAVPICSIRHGIVRVGELSSSCLPHATSHDLRSVIEGGRSRCCLPERRA